VAQNVDRVLVIGLDCATPQFVFGPDAFDLPNLRAIMKRGRGGPLKSCDPPITVPAWTCMTSGLDPGALGIYGFHNRTDHSYAPMRIADATSVRAPRVWDIISQHGKRVIVLGVPQTYPVSPVNGYMVADFLAPDTSVQYTYPASLKNEIGDYILDVADFRTNDKSALLKRIHAMMNNRFDTAQYLMDTKPWDFFMMVEMGIDRIHHAFWGFCDPNHPAYDPDGPYRHVIRDYYQAVDARVGDLVARAGADTAVIVVSDHGAKRMHGGVRINQWLINEGYLTINPPMPPSGRIEECDIDWAQTKAWAAGGYYGRIFLNVVGREPNGIVPPDQYDSMCQTLIQRLENMAAPNGLLLKNEAFRPKELYKTVNGVPPDILVYFGRLDWRAIGTVDQNSLYTVNNDTGPDDANHSHYGIFIANRCLGSNEEDATGLGLTDVAPILLNLLGIKIPAHMQAKYEEGGV